MDKFVIEGGKKLSGTVKISGSKNAALPALIASLLTDEICVVERVPDLRDISTTFRLLQSLGKKTEYSQGRAIIKSGGRLSASAPYELVKEMRASALVAGPLLARFRAARVPLPGGCAIGLRPIDLHLKGFEKLGASVSTDAGDIVLSARALKGADIKLAFPSVGATENLLMCAALTPGKTVISNSAAEPEIDDLIACLSTMGARIRREGNSIIVNGASSLSGSRHRVSADRIEAGTYMLAVSAAGGEAVFEDCEPKQFSSLLRNLKKTGVSIRVQGKAVALKSGGRPAAFGLTTAPYPGFPTDLQAPWLAYMCLSHGECVIKEKIFENRFMHAAELLRMGAKISVEGAAARVCGAARLSGAKVMASDLRGGAALVVAALAARGTTTVQRVYHIDRGYESMEKKLSGLGAAIRRVS